MSEINEINWFPGHMKKAIGKIQEKIKQCDGVIEIGDARAPFSSFPDYLDRITEGKVKVLVFSKSDLADPSLFRKQLDTYKEKGFEPFAFDLRSSKASKPMINYLSTLKTKADERYQRLGFPLPPKRFIVLGIPNVGKSTFINCLAGKKKAEVENRPGKTRAEPLIHVSDKLFIFDAPGILEPNYEDKTEIAKLAVLGSVKTEILPIVALTDFMMDYLKSHYPDNVKNRYNVSLEGNDAEIFKDIASKRGFLSNGGTPDSDRARLMVLKELRAGELGRITLDE
ncbi:MAG: ribosome biogenesis GTPase YlqF [Bacilli bacterium]